MDMQQKNSECFLYVADEWDSSSSEALDLSSQRRMSPSLINVSTSSSVPFIPSNEVNKQRPNINCTQLVSYTVNNAANLFWNHWHVSQKRKEQTDGDGQINCNQINNVLINNQFNDHRINGQINYNQSSNKRIKVDQTRQKKVKNRQIVNDYINVNQANVQEISSNHSNNRLSTGQSLLNPISTTNSINLPYLSVNNMSMLNTGLSSFPVTMSVPYPETKKSIDMLESIAKSTRPFKAYPKDPLVFNAGDEITSKVYKKFREHVLEHIRQMDNRSTNGKMRRTPNKNRPGSPTSSTNDDEKDSAYLERRKKNNEAAKRSRDARRAKEDEVAIRATFLEGQNAKLKATVTMLLNIVRENNIPFDLKNIQELEL